jgi:hypothetical protein
MYNYRISLSIVDIIGALSGYLKLANRRGESRPPPRLRRATVTWRASGPASASDPGRAMAPHALHVPGARPPQNTFQIISPTRTPPVMARIDPST